MVDSRFRRHRDALIAHRLAERVGSRNQRDGGQVAALEIGEDFLASHLVRMRCLEHPFSHRLDDLNGAGKRNERYLGFFEIRDHRQRRPRRGAAHHGGDLVLFHQPRRKCVRVARVPAVIVDDQLEFLSVHPALGVDLRDVQFEGLLLRIAEEGGRTRHRQHRTDLDLSRCVLWAGNQGREADCGHGDDARDGGHRELLGAGFSDFPSLFFIVNNTGARADY